MSTIQSLTEATQELLSRHRGRIRNSNAHMENISNRILELEAELMVLKRHRNECSPINSLPPEILAKIFLAVQSSLPAPGTRTHGQPRPACATWIWVAHVCQYWRNVALGCAELWSHITNFALERPDFLDALLSRSKDYPLSVNLDIPYHTKDVARVISQVHRIRLLDATDLSGLGGNEGDVVLPNCVGRAAPLLETLVLSCHPKENRVIPSGFLSGGCTSLRRLDVTFHDIKDWKDLPLGSGLAHLHIACPSTQHYRPPMHELLDCLDQMKALEVLDLSHFIPRPGPRPSTPISVASLRKLRLWDATESLVTFFQTIRFPKSTAVELVMASLPNGWNLKSLWKSLLLSWNASPSHGGTHPMPGDVERPGEEATSEEHRPTVGRLDIMGYECGQRSRIPEIVLRFVDSNRGPLGFQHICREPGSNESNWSFVEIFQGLTSAFDFTQTKELTIEMSDPLPREVWNALKLLKHLERISFTLSAIEQFLDWWSDDAGINDARLWISANSDKFTPRFPAATSSLPGPTAETCREQRVVNGKL